MNTSLCGVNISIMTGWKITDTCKWMSVCFRALHSVFHALLSGCDDVFACVFVSHGVCIDCCVIERLDVRVAVTLGGWEMWRHLDSVCVFLR